MPYQRVRCGDHQDHEPGTDRRAKIDSAFSTLHRADAFEAGEPLGHVGLDVLGLGAVHQLLGLGDCSGCRARAFNPQLVVQVCATFLSREGLSEAFVENSGDLRGFSAFLAVVHHCFDGALHVGAYADLAGCMGVAVLDFDGGECCSHAWESAVGGV